MTVPGLSTAEALATAISVIGCVVALLAALYAREQARASHRANQIARQTPWTELILQWVRDECIALADDRARFRTFMVSPHEDAAAKERSRAELLALRKAANEKLYQLSQFEERAKPLLETRRKLESKYDSFFENGELWLTEEAQKQPLSGYEAAYSTHVKAIREFAGSLGDAQ